MAGTTVSLKETHENELTLKPAGMTYEEAAATPQAGLLALQGLRDKRQIRPGQRILIKDINILNELFESGRVKPVVDRCFPLSETAEAFQYFGEGHFKVKVVITVKHNNNT